MKDNSLDGHRGKVALSDTTRNAAQINSATNNNTNAVGSSSSLKCDLKTTPPATTPDGNTATNFDDDYNEWELGIGDLIIDLDADIEKTNERNGNQQGIPSQHHHHHSGGGGHHQNGTAPSPGTGGSSNNSSVDSPNNSSSNSSAFNFLGTQTTCNNNNNLAAAMSNSKSPRLSGNSGTGGSVAGSGAVSTSGSNSNNNGTTGASGTFEHQATVDKGLKMKIKRKTVGNKYSEAKHEIVQSDTKSAASSHPLSENINSSNSNNCSSSTSASNSPAASTDAPKSKHSSSKGRNSSHREKKEKNRDKEKNSNVRNNSSSSSSSSSNNNNTTAAEVNGVLNVMSPLKITNTSVSSISSPAPPSLSSPLPSNNGSSNNSSSSASASPSVSRGSAGQGVANSPVSTSNNNNICAQEIPQPTLINLPSQTVSASSSPPMPNLTLKLENSKFSPSPVSQSCSVPSVVLKPEDRPQSPPLKKMKLEPMDVNEEGDCPGSPGSPEMKDTSTCTSVGTITEPDCLGPCEPGTSVMLEGIVWQETEGGVLVVNVTWRGKTYVGTLLDCTKHDWAPPRFCESPTSDVDSKASKGRGKRGRGGNNSASEISFTDTRNCVQSKLRNGKGRRTTINSNASSSGFTVPNSPAKNDSSASNKRKSRPNEPVEASNPISESKTSKRSRTQSRAMPTSAPQGAADLPQPSSPQLITCPEPNCSKRYKHPNGLKYHRAHAHSASDSSKMDDTTTEDSKDVTNSSDNEESLQESASVSTSPAPSFANSVPSSGGGKNNLLNSETASSSSSSVSGLPESDPYSLTTDLSTLAAVAISDSTAEQKAPGASANLHSNASQDISPLANSDGDMPPSVLPVSMSPSPNPAPPLSDVVVAAASSAPSVGGTGLSTAVSAVTTSVIQSSNSMDSIAASSQPPPVAMNIPTPHVIFSQGMLGTNGTTTCTTSSTIVCNNNNSSGSSPSRNNSISSNVTTTFAAISSIASTTISSPTTPLPMMDKCKIKQERPDKYKPKSPSAASSAIRPIVPAPTPLIALSSNMPGTLPGMNLGSHCVNPALKPIQPKPTILGEPNTVNPALESLKKEKSKHKKKSKDKERDKKLPMSLTPTKMGMNPNEECEALELTSYPSLEAVSGPLPGGPHPSLSPLISQSKPPDTSMDMSLPEDTMNENIQSPAYSDISDANDTAPVLESEVPSGKEKEDKVGKTTPDASQSPATNIAGFGMYPYYSQPPYLLPSVSPQSAMSGSQGQNIIEKGDLSKKGDQERVKENRPWSNPGVDARERQHLEHHELDKKQSREESVPSSNPLASSAAGGVPIQEYPIPQHYTYPYGYVQGYPYPMETSSYHMHMLETDPHYKQQYKQYIDDHNRMYKEQQHHHQQQQLQQLQQQAHQHQQQQQQQQQAAAAAAHHAHHHAQHQSHHQSGSSSKSHHSVKDERGERSSRESSKDRGVLDKMSGSNAMMVEHSSKIQHSSNPMSASSASKDQDVRGELDMRPPSLPAQARIDPSSSAVSLKEKQNENHQILKENIELKSQMDESKNKANQYEMAMLFERHKEDMRRFYTYQDRMIEQQQQKMEPGIHHHTHHHQTIQTHGHLQSSSYSASLKTMKEDLSIHAKSNHYGGGGDSTRSSVVSPAKSDHIKHLHSTNSTSSPKGGGRDRDSSSSLGSSKDYMRESKKESSKSSSDRSESSSREDSKKGENKAKVEPKVESEGQKPTMETTGPPPPPTNSYAYLHPSYLQPPPPHFAHMPFEPAHAMYRGGLNPMIVSTPHYANSPYMHPQIRYVAPGACELPVHPQPPDPMGKQMHPAAPPKALDLLHQVSQQYTTTHKIHELADHAIMSPTPTSTPSSTPSTSSSSSGGKTSTTEPVVAVSKVEVGGSRDASRSPPTQRHLHTHHHTHVGVGYPIYDPYGAIIAPGATPPVDCKPIHPLQVKPSNTPSAGTTRFWP